MALIFLPRVAEVRWWQTTCCIIAFRVHTIYRYRLHSSTWLRDAGIWSAGNEMPPEFALGRRQNFFYPRAAPSCASLSTSSSTRGSRYWRVWQLVLLSPLLCSISFLQTIMCPNPRQHQSLNLLICSRSNSYKRVCQLLSSPSQREWSGALGIGWKNRDDLMILRVVRKSCMGSFSFYRGLKFYSLRQRWMMLRMQDSGVVLGSKSYSRSMSS